MNVNAAQSRIRLNPGKWRTPFKRRAYRIVRKILIGFILASLVNFVFSYLFYTPKVYDLVKQNGELLIKYRMLQDKIGKSTELLEEIGERDRGIYRSLFAIDTQAVAPGISSETRYNDYKGNRYYPEIEKTWQYLDLMANRLYYQSVSFDTLQYLARDKEKMADAIPAIWPMDKNKLRGRLGRFGGRFHPILKRYLRHTGLDMPGRKGTPIYATAEGTVVSSGYESGYGLAVVVNHGYGYKTRYAHLSKIGVKAGQKVKRGEQVGEMGSTGRSTGTHLHYEVIYRGQFMNPVNFLSRDMSDEDYRKIVESAEETTYEAD